MSAKIVSIIIPTYNYGHLITETLNCLLDQTYKNWEAIIIDDGSTDDTEKVVKAFIEYDTRIIYIKQKNEGVTVSRNNGLKIAKGDYIQFLDADDLISKDKLKLQIDFLEKCYNIDICLVATRFFNSNDKHILYTDLSLKNKTVMPSVTGFGYNVISDFIQSNLTVIQSPLFKRRDIEKIGFFRDDMHYLEDWDFWFRFAIGHLNFGYLNDNRAMALVRSHSVSASKQSNKIIIAEGKLRNLINKYISNSTLLNSQKKELIILNNKLLINTFKHLMAKTSYANINIFLIYYKEMKSTSKFIKAFIKSINLKRKLMS